jgi:hypothetical protein
MTKWKLTRLMVAASFGVLYAVFAMLGSTITAVTGIPAVSGGIFISLAGGFVFALACLSLRSFGSAALAGLFYGILALAFPAMGPPGFAPKIVIGVIGGVIADLMFRLLRRWEVPASISAGGFSQAAIGVTIIGAGLLLGMPGIERASKLLWIALAGGLVIGGIGGFIGQRIYNQLKDTNLFRRLRAQ